MGLENYVSEAEAIQRSGVSIKTLQRFVEAGYLSVEVEPDGLRLYSRSQLDEIFGIHTAPISLEPIEEDQDGNPIDSPTSTERDTAPAARSAAVALATGALATEALATEALATEGTRNRGNHCEHWNSASKWCPTGTLVDITVRRVCVVLREPRNPTISYCLYRRTGSTRSCTTTCHRG